MDEPINCKIRNCPVEYCFCRACTQIKSGLGKLKIKSPAAINQEFKDVQEGQALHETGPNTSEIMRPTLSENYNALHFSNLKSQENYRRNDSISVIKNTYHGFGKMTNSSHSVPVDNPSKQNRLEFGKSRLEFGKRLNNNSYQEKNLGFGEVKKKGQKEKASLPKNHQPLHYLKQTSDDPQQPIFSKDEFGKSATKLKTRKEILAEGRAKNAALKKAWISECKKSQKKPTKLELRSEQSVDTPLSTTTKSIPVSVDHRDDNLFHSKLSTENLVFGNLIGFQSTKKVKSKGKSKKKLREKNESEFNENPNVQEKFDYSKYSGIYADIDSVDSEIANLLDGVVMTISGYEDPLRSDILRKAVAMGVKYKSAWTENCTHLICGFPNTFKYLQAKGRGEIVTCIWIEDCYKMRKKLDLDKYILSEKNDDIEVSKVASTGRDGLRFLAGMEIRVKDNCLAPHLAGQAGYVCRQDNMKILVKIKEKGQQLVSPADLEPLRPKGGDKAKSLLWGQKEDVVEVRKVNKGGATAVVRFDGYKIKVVKLNHLCRFNDALM